MESLKSVFLLPSIYFLW